MLLARFCTCCFVAHAGWWLVANRRPWNAPGLGWGRSLSVTLTLQRHQRPSTLAPSPPYADRARRSVLTVAVGMKGAALTAASTSPAGGRGLLVRDQVVQA